ncbi:MAG: phosphorylase, partial [Betaproteobacteria bacterium]|nr:phosphorylase [Betaproteobacteria bacterium]
MTDKRLDLAPGSLVPALDACTRRALACGAMQPIETVEEQIRDTGVDFVVRRVSSLARKAADRRRAKEHTGKRLNPFLPHDPDLFVAEVSDTHLALLNKFNVLERHLLIVTRAFVHQETLLDEADFAALAACMAQMDALGFYNGGEAAGASQSHKHLQLVPLPLAGRGPPVPMEMLFDAVRGQGGVVQVPGIGFLHVFAWIDP